MCVCGRWWRKRGTLSKIVSNELIYPTLSLDIWLSPSLPVIRYLLLPDEQQFDISHGYPHNTRTQSSPTTSYDVCGGEKERRVRKVVPYLVFLEGGSATLGEADLGAEGFDAGGGAERVVFGAHLLAPGAHDTVGSSLITRTAAVCTHTHARRSVRRVSLNPRDWYKVPTMKQEYYSYVSVCVCVSSLYWLANKKTRLLILLMI